MSLINTTLKNLENQKQSGPKSAADDNILSGLNTSLTQEKRSYVPLLVVIILLFILGVVCYFDLQKINTSKSALPIKHKPKEKAVMKKIDIPLTPEQKLAEQYQNALTLIVNNQADAAFGKLYEILRKYPDYVGARITLAALLLKNGYIKEANRILVRGLAGDPKNIKLLEFQANILVRHKKINQALMLLRKHKPGMRQSPEYYAFMAVLYHHQRKFMRAANIYKQLIKVYPDRAVWWVGLGVALESAGKSRAARDAYTYALQRGAGLDSNTRAYVAHHIAKLS
jgi:MSHA biogenesis protein MshN